MSERHATGKPLAALTEPLGESAPIASKLAARHCDRRDPESSCLLYHSAWQYFRLIGLIRTIASDDDFLISALQNLASTGQFDRVLISGSADYGTLARVIHAYRKVGREPRVTLVDICRTPLELNRWLAQRESANLETVQSDILEFTSEQPFDLICTHSFIGRFHGRRGLLLKGWHGLLRPGGHIVTTTRIRPGMTDIVRFSPHEVETFTARALELARSCGELGAVKPQTIAGWAREYAQRKFNYPLNSCEELAASFARAGLHVTSLDRVCGQNDKPSGPSLGIRSERIRIVASRP
jgi:SAM-dependent methyltransferase